MEGKPLRGESLPKVGTLPYSVGKFLRGYDVMSRGTFQAVRKNHRGHCTILSFRMFLVIDGFIPRARGNRLFLD